MDTARLAAIRAREQAATPGPWVAWHDPEISAYLDPIWQWRVAQDDTRIQGTVLIIKAAWNEADAAFIAAARADVPDLLAEIDRLRTIAAALYDEARYARDALYQQGFRWAGDVTPYPDNPYRERAAK